jgi:hypothetical protein
MRILKLGSSATLVTIVLTIVACNVNQESKRQQENQPVKAKSDQVVQASLEADQRASGLSDTEDPYSLSSGKVRGGQCPLPPGGPGQSDPCECNVTDYGEAQTCYLETEDKIARGEIDRGQALDAFCECINRN